MPTVAEIMADVREKNLMQKQASAQPAAAASQGAPQEEEMAKLAEDLYLSGRIAGIGWFDSVMAKTAEEPVPARSAAPPSAANSDNDKSQFLSVAEKLKKFHGGQASGSVPTVAGSNPNVVAETTAPPLNKEKNPNATHSVG